MITNYVGQDAEQDSERSEWSCEVSCFNKWPICH